MQACLRFIPDYRGDEGLLLASFTDEAGNVLALHTTHVTPAGEKSRIKPVRQMWRGPHDWRSCALIRFDGKVGKTFVIAEGLENALSLIVAGCPPRCRRRRRRSRSLRPAGRRRDARHRPRRRRPGSQADFSVHRGIVRSLAQRLAVKITAPASGSDPNDLLRTDGPEALKALVDGASMNLGRFDTTAFTDELYRLDEMHWGFTTRERKRSSTSPSRSSIRTGAQAAKNTRRALMRQKRRSPSNSNPGPIRCPTSGWFSIRCGTNSGAIS